jgi:predicted TIM-barrel fold metal-dependent hydrolase
MSNSRNNKSERDAPIESPIAFSPCSNGEYCPTEPTARDRRAEARFRELTEEKSRRLGISRREFAESACGFATALFVINELYGCSDAPGASGGDGGRDGGVVGRDSAGYDVGPEAMEDAGLACERLMGDEFIFDVQTHPPEPLAPWSDEPLSADAETYIRALFVTSDTTVACLSGIPAARNPGLENVDANRMIREIVERLAGPRLLYHVNVDPPRGASELDYMEELAASYQVAAWKVYPHVGAWRLDGDDGLAFVDKARELGVLRIAAHRGLGADSGAYDQPSSPIDLVRAARMNPDVAFLTYHSGWERSVDENHPFDPADPNPRGVDRLIKAVRDEGLAPGSNVYGELGSTWRGLMTDPTAAAHVLGKLLLYLGEDRVVYGTDSVFTGSPMEQIVALRTFEIPLGMQEEFGYPALTDAIRAKIFGLNGAAAYGIDPEAMRCVIADDFVERLRMMARLEPGSNDVRLRKAYGPRTRREYLAFLDWEAHLHRG